MDLIIKYVIFVSFLMINWVEILSFHYSSAVAWQLYFIVILTKIVEYWREPRKMKSSRFFRNDRPYKAYQNSPYVPPPRRNDVMALTLAIFRLQSLHHSYMDQVLVSRSQTSDHDDGDVQENHLQVRCGQLFYSITLFSELVLCQN